MEPISIIAGISAGVKSVQSIVSLLKDTKTLVKDDKNNDAIEIINNAQGLVSQTLDDLLQSKSNAIELQEENQSLKRHIQEMDDWKERKSHYELISTEGGAMVYHHKNDPPHYVCPSCMENKQIYPLQNYDGYSGFFRCPKCNVDYPIKHPDTRVFNMME